MNSIEKNYKPKIGDLLYGLRGSTLGENELGYVLKVLDFKKLIIKKLIVKSIKYNVMYEMYSDSMRTFYLIQKVKV